MRNPDSAELFVRLASELGAHPFDLMVVCDGSGTTIDAPCGWFAGLYEPAAGRVWWHHGGLSAGTNNCAELMPVCMSLWARHVEPEPLASGRPARVLVVSDSEVTVRCGTGQYQRKANGALWAPIEWFERNGYAFDWRHVPRNSNPLNERADRCAGRVRLAMVKLRSEL